MLGIYLGIDEFNTMVLANFLAWKLKKVDPRIKLATVTRAGYESLFNEFDKVVIDEFFHSSHTYVDYLADNAQARVANSARAQLLLQNICEEILDIELLQKLCNLSVTDDIHKTCLQLSNEYLLDKGIMIKAKTYDIKSREHFLNLYGVSDKYYLIIGRNRSVHTEYNNLLRMHILKNLLLGRTVINATFPNPNLKFHKFFSKYFQLSQELVGYGITVAFMQRSISTIVLGNSGGISIHMLTSARLNIVGRMNWINGKNFSYQGQTLFKTRRKVGLTTRHTWIGESPLNIIKNVVNFLKRNIS